ncbi:MAG: hypothetical protein ABI647_15875 [Gemmatimonadota bacterium]
MTWLDRLRGSSIIVAASLVAASPALSAQDHPAGHRHVPGMMHGRNDSSRAALSKRGAEAMRVDQDRSTHHFDALPDGGRIALESDTDDSAAVSGIRAHFAEIETAFRRGDFAIPMFVHAGEVPGTKILTARRDRIVYRRADLPRGAELRLRTTDRAALRAIHQFMAFQRREHRAGGVH